MDHKEIEALMLETHAVITVMQAQVQALMLVSPHGPAIHHFYLQQMERHFARGLGSPLPEQFLQALELAHQKALKQMPGAPATGA